MSMLSYMVCASKCPFPAVPDLQMARHLVPSGAIRPEEWSFFLGRPGVDLAPGSGPQKVGGG
jgi:hypothetical protein